MHLTYTAIQSAKETTLLLTTPVAPALRSQAAGWLMRREKDIRQVAFLDESEGRPALSVPDGAPDLGALMGLGAWLARQERVPLGESESYDLTLSEPACAVSCTVTPVHTCSLVTAQLPLPEKMENFAFPLSDGSITLPVVSFPGVSYILAPAGTVARTSAQEALRYWSNLLSGTAAAMVIWNEGARTLDVLEYRKSTGAAAWRAGSPGAAGALCAWLTSRERRGQCLTLKQSGGTHAVVSRWREGLASLSVSATVELRRDKEIDFVF